MRALLPLLAICEVQQLLPINVCCTDRAWVLAPLARVAGIGVTARTVRRVSLDTRRWDEARARRVGTVCGVWGGEFEDEVLVHGNEVGVQESRYSLDRDSVTTALEWLLLLEGELECF